MLSHTKAKSLEIRTTVTYFLQIMASDKSFWVNVAMSKDKVLPYHAYVVSFGSVKFKLNFKLKWTVYATDCLVVPGQ